MKMKPQKFVRLLKELSLNWLLNPIVISFKEEGATISQMDATSTAYVYALIEKEFFTDYKAVGDVVLSKEYAKLIKKVFRGDDDVEINVDSKIVIKGSIDVLEIDLMSTEQINVVRDASIVVVGDVMLLEKAKVLRGFVVDLQSLLDVAIEDKVTFRFTESLEAYVQGTTYKHLRRIPATPFTGDEKGETTMYTDILKQIANIGGKAYIVFTEGPIEFYIKTPAYRCLIAVSTVV